MHLSLQYYIDVRAIHWVDVLNRLGYHPKKRGKALVIRCVFHKETTASLTLYRGGRFVCHGCGKDGDVFDFVLYRMGGDSRKAIRFIAKKFGIIPNKAKES